MKQIKKVSCLVLAALMATSTMVLGACNGSDENEKYKNEGKSPINVSLYFGEFGVDWLKEIAKGFNETTTSNYYVEVSDHKNLTPTIVADIKTGTDKDVFIALDANYQMLYQGDYLEDLSDILTEKPDGDLTVQQMIKDYDSWSAVGSSGDKLYMLPFNTSPVGLIFDYDRFLEEGWLITDADGSVSAGKDGVKGTYDDGQPTTWAEFDALLAKISLKTKDVFSYMGSVHPEYVNNIVYAYMAQYMGAENYQKFLNHDTNGSEVVMEDGTRQSFGIEEGYKALSMDGVKDSLEFVANYLANSEYVAARTLTDGSFNVNNSHTAFLENESVFLVEGNWWENGSRSLIASREKYGGKPYGQADYRYFLLPAIEGQNSAADQTYFFSQNGGSIVVPKNKDEAKVAAIKDFLVYMLKSENMEKSTVDTGLLWNYNYEIKPEMKDKMTKFGKNTYAMFNDSERVTVRTFFLDCAAVPYYAYSSAGTSALYSSKNGQSYVIPAFTAAKNSADTLHSNIISFTQSNWAGYLREAQGFGFYTEK